VFEDYTQFEFYIVPRECAKVIIGEILDQGD